MGIFGTRDRRPFTLTPDLCLAIGMVYTTASDGRLGETERHDLRKVVPDERVLHAALDYCRSHATTEFLVACVAMLSAQQKLCLLLNMAAAAMVDGELADEEREVLREFQAAFEVADETMAPHLASLALKNARHLFAAGGRPGA